MALDPPADAGRHKTEPLSPGSQQRAGAAFRWRHLGEAPAALARQQVAAAAVIRRQCVRRAAAATGRLYHKVGVRVGGRAAQAAAHQRPLGHAVDAAATR